MDASLGLFARSKKLGRLLALASSTSAVGDILHSPHSHVACLPIQIALLLLDIHVTALENVST